MPYTLLISTSPEERRVALLEGSEVREFYAERRYDRGLVGNIYKGRVLRVMPSMDAAFIEIGTGRAAFLQAADALVPRDAVPDGVEAEEEADGSARLAVDAIADEDAPRRGGTFEVGQDVLVQVTRDAFGGKGPRLSTQLSLPGRNLVFFPHTPLIGVSRRIADEAERARLRAAARDRLPPGSGAILRTAAVGRPESEIADDLAFLSALWQRIEQYAADLSAPKLVHEDLDLLLRTARDLLTAGCDRVLVDTDSDHDRLLQFVDSFMPQLDHLVERWQGQEPLFERFGVELTASSLLDRVVWLKSGGSIVIDHTEALTAIDVNTGSGTRTRSAGGGAEGATVRSVSGGDPEDAIFKTNLEAAREIACQLRLRNIGGIVVIDFIDMREPEHRAKVHETLTAELANDKAQADVLPMSRLGLVELTRRRARDAVFSRMTDPCPYCDARGWVRSVEQVCGDAIRKAARELSNPQARGVRVLAHPKVIETLIETYRTSLADLETRWQKSIKLIRREDFHVEGYSIRRD
ncbi:MAG: Rne/Rng family ribonuclease [Deltaproteobacteria bacterium]|nr:Rne/Rng family ribonuclease [Deltaproteobacteria bacterium]